MFHFKNTRTIFWLPQNNERKKKTNLVPKLKTTVRNRPSACFEKSGASTIWVSYKIHFALQIEKRKTKKKQHKKSIVETHRTVAKKLAIVLLPLLEHVLLKTAGFGVARTRWTT